MSLSPGVEDAVLVVIVTTLSLPPPFPLHSLTPQRVLPTPSRLFRSFLPPRSSTCCIRSFYADLS